MSLELINSSIQGIIEKSTAFGALTILIDKSGKASITVFTPPYLTDMEKIVSRTTLSAAAAHIVAQVSAQTARNGIALNDTATK